MDAELIGHQEESFSKEVTDSMRNDAVSLHLSETQTSCPTSSVGGLSGESYNWSSGTCVHLIIDQMSQSLVVDGPDEDEIL